MSAAELVVIVAAAILGAAALCWFAVEVAVRRVRSGRPHMPESTRRDGV